MHRLKTRISGAVFLELKDDEPQGRLTILAIERSEENKISKSDVSTVLFLDISIQTVWDQTSVDVL